MGSSVEEDKIISTRYSYRVRITLRFFSFIDCLLCVPGGWIHFLGVEDVCHNAYTFEKTT